jgi:hypothetical protein
MFRQSRFSEWMLFDPQEHTYIDLEYLWRDYEVKECIFSQEIEGPRCTCRSCSYIWYRRNDKKIMQTF